MCPSKYSIPINQYLLNNGSINNLIVLDSTWNTIGTLKSLPQLNKLPWIHLSNYSTEYWRPQKGLSSGFLRIKISHGFWLVCAEKGRLF